MFHCVLNTSLTILRLQHSFKHSAYLQHYQTSVMGHFCDNISSQMFDRVLNKFIENDHNERVEILDVLWIVTRRYYFYTPCSFWQNLINLRIKTVQTNWERQHNCSFGMKRIFHSELFSMSFHPSDDQKVHIENLIFFGVTGRISSNPITNISLKFIPSFGNNLKISFDSFEGY